MGQRKTQTSKKLKYSRLATSVKLMPPAFCERFIGMADGRAKANQIREVENGHLTPRILRRKATQEAIKNEVYDKAWRAMEDEYENIMRLVESYQTIGKADTESTGNEEISLRNKERNAAGLKRIRNELASTMETVRAADAVVRNHLSWVEQKNRNKVLSYWKGLLRTDKRAEVGVEPVFFPVETDEVYDLHLKAMETAVASILSGTTSMEPGEEATEAMITM